MDNKLSNIKERILQIANNENISYEKFCEIIGVTYGNFKGENKKRPINSNVLENILTIFPNYNPDWLLTGSGNMMKVRISSNEEILGVNYKELWLERLELINLQKEKIKNLEEEINRIKKAKENSSGYGMVAESKQKLKSK